MENAAEHKRSKLDLGAPAAMVLERKQPESANPKRTRRKQSAPEMVLRGVIPGAGTERRFSELVLGVSELKCDECMCRCESLKRKRRSKRVHRPTAQRRQSELASGLSDAEIFQGSDGEHSRSEKAPSDDNKTLKGGRSARRLSGIIEGYSSGKTFSRDENKGNTYCSEVRRRKSKSPMRMPELDCSVYCRTCDSGYRKRSAPELMLTEGTRPDGERRRKSDFGVGGCKERPSLCHCCCQSNRGKDWQLSGLENPDGTQIFGLSEATLRAHEVAVTGGEGPASWGPCSDLVLEVPDGEDLLEGSVSLQRARQMVAAAVAEERRRRSVAVPLIGFLVLLAALAAFVVAVSLRMTPPALPEPQRGAVNAVLQPVGASPNTEVGSTGNSTSVMAEGTASTSSGPSFSNRGLL